MGIIDPREIERIETARLGFLYEWIFRAVHPNLVLEMRLIRDLHKQWLWLLYPFAGQLRMVNVSKNGALFAPIDYLPHGIQEMDARLRRVMPCTDLTLSDLSAAIAEIHVELLLLHPFREGNGRLGRLVAD